MALLAISPQNRSPRAAIGLELGQIYTDFMDDGKDSRSPLRSISNSNYPYLTRYWVPPFPESAPYTDLASPAAYTYKQKQLLQVYGAIVDPFTPIHVLSSMFPAQALQLPPWTWQSALRTMTAFFHVGSLLVGDGGDVPGYDAVQKLTSKDARDDPSADITMPGIGATTGAGVWSWLQPYVEPGTEGDVEKAPVWCCCCC